jgi:hypothetical protein
MDEDLSKNNRAREQQQEQKFWWAILMLKFQKFTNFQ